MPSCYLEYCSYEIMSEMKSVLVKFILHFAESLANIWQNFLLLHQIGNILFHQNFILSCLFYITLENKFLINFLFHFTLFHEYFHYEEYSFQLSDVQAAFSKYIIY